MITLTGIPASPGIVIGKAFLFDIGSFKIEKRKIASTQIEVEVQQFKAAILKTREEIKKLEEKVQRDIGEDIAKIFSAHLSILEDPLLILDVTQKIRKETVCAEYALECVLQNIANNFSIMEDEYFRERAVDVFDIGRRILHNLMGVVRISIEDLTEKVIIIAHELSPSDTAHMNDGNVLGFVAEIGGKTAHAAIMARALEIPAVVGLKEITCRVRNDEIIIVDGSHGTVIINPDKETLEKYSRKQEEYSAFKEGLTCLRDLPAQTEDGFRVLLSANIGTAEEIDIIKREGAEGVGLYRTEYLYLERTDFPAEEEQFNAYKDVILRLTPCPTVIRTVDLGGDKFLTHLDLPIETNPFLGLRAIRLCLKYPEIFKVQMRAILRASNYGKVQLMFPLISEIDEFGQAKSILLSAMKELDRENIPFDHNIQIGIMVETPSAALIADRLAKEVDFFSIGTNDLIQYTMAIDRVNEEVAALYKPFHPAILRLIQMTINAAHNEGKWVGMCGEMAGDPLYTVLLLGMGLDEFSMSGSSIARIKKIIRAIRLDEAKAFAAEIMQITSAGEIQKMLEETMIRKFGNILEM
ncbi:phosphoenolpyruvate--protein phosphotransferase [Candidatus Desantisbacteria bacterium]|nr:phosphoenolpyruvate--protein phosphotransferase [Candidatus Desantisbacteria bacterium]